MPFLLLFVAVPIIEIFLFIEVGGLIGTWPTILIVLLTAFLGTYLLRAQGTMAMQNLRSSFSELRDPTEHLAHGAMILFAGALLLTPGFLTDAFGFLLLFPPFRTAAYHYLRKRVKVQSFTVGPDPRSADPREPYGDPRMQDPDVIDGDFEEVKPTQKSDDPSGWTKH